MKNQLIGIFIAVLPVFAHAAKLPDCSSPTQILGRNPVENMEHKHEPACLTITADSDGNMVIKSIMTVDVDGAPSAYAKKNLGLDYIGNSIDYYTDRNEWIDCGNSCVAKFLLDEKDWSKAGSTFCGFALEPDRSAGKKLVPCNRGKGYTLGKGGTSPKEGTPFTGVDGSLIVPYVSTTTVKHRVGGAVVSVDSQTIPFIVTPGTGAKKVPLGTIVWVGGKGWYGQFAVVADIGPAFGEGSVALHQLLRDNAINKINPGYIKATDRCRKSEQVSPPYRSAIDPHAELCKKICDDGDNDVACKVKGGTNIRADVGFTQEIEFVVLTNAVIKLDARNFADQLIFVAKDPKDPKEFVGSIEWVARTAGYTDEKIQELRKLLKE